jgi:hypothetical protein
MFLTFSEVNSFRSGESRGCFDPEDEDRNKPSMSSSKLSISTAFSCRAGGAFGAISAPAAVASSGGGKSKRGEERIVFHHRVASKGKREARIRAENIYQRPYK